MNRNAKIVVWSLVGVLAGALFLGGAALVATRTFLRCTVYATQSSLQVEATGRGARAACRELVAGGAFSDRRPDGPTGAHVVCDGLRIDNYSLTVRDTGWSLVGSEACDSLREWMLANRT